MVELGEKLIEYVKSDDKLKEELKSKCLNLAAKLLEVV
jgi:hypothetical protein